MTRPSSPDESETPLPTERDSSWWKSFGEALLGDESTAGDEGREPIEDLQRRFVDARAVVDQAVSRWFSEGPGQGLESRLDRIEAQLETLIDIVRKDTLEDDSTD